METYSRKRMLALADLLDMGKRERNKNDMEDSALSVMMNGGPVCCNFRQDEVWKLSLNLGT